MTHSHKLVSNMLRLLSVAWILWSLAGFDSAHADVAIPPYSAPVVDLTGTLSAQQMNDLSAQLNAFQAKKGAQIAVLLVPSTKPEEIEQYGIRVAEQWKVGRKGVDDGAILLVAKNDRRVRIEVGYGLEGVLNDAISKRIIDQEITPRFRQGDFYGGVQAGVDRMMRVIEGEPLPPPSQSRTSTSNLNFENIQAIFLIGIFLVFAVGGVLRSIFGRFVGASIVGGFAGVAAWFIAGPILVAIIIAVIAFFITLFGGGGRGWHNRGGWHSGGWGGGGFGSGGGGFGGGGGGSFGGGGASGRW